MTMALDIGSGRMKSLRYEHERLIVRSCASMYAAVPDTPAHRRVLGQLAAPYAVCDRSLLLIGDAAAEHSPLFQVPCTPLLPEGKLPESDPPARQVISTVVDALLPPPRTREDICGVILPGAWFHNSAPTKEFQFFTRLVELRGYESMVLGAATAAVLAEAGDRSFTGIGLTIGAATSEISIVHRARELLRIPLRRGGNWIDAQLARRNGSYIWDAQGHQYLDTRGIAAWKHSVTAEHAGDARLGELMDLVRELQRYLIAHAVDRLAQQRHELKISQPLRLVCAGGTTQIPGFREVLREMLTACRFPLQIEEIRMAGDPELAIARGCLIRAELEAETRDNQNQAA